MKPEILAPAGNWAMLNAAKNAGADAIYFGIKGLNMRHSAKNFEITDLKEIGKLDLKKYITLNTVIYDTEINKVKKIIEEAYSSGINAVICWDMVVLQTAKDYGMDIHLSTQASVSNLEAIKAYQKLGVKRFILARELSLEQIKNIRSHTHAELECFIHGAMCVAVSGRCFMSNFINGFSANRGKCFQPCRRPYLIKDKDSGYELEVGNNYILSPKDLCTMPFIDKIIDAGINSLKIEGRSKTPEYVDCVVRAYRKAVDAYEENKLDEKLKDLLTKDLSQSYHRGFSSGFYLGKPLNAWAAKEGNVSNVKKIEVGKVINFYNQKKAAAIKIFAGGFEQNDLLLVVGNKSGVVKQKVSSIEKNNEKIKEAKKGDVVAIKFNKKVRENDKVYKIISS
ncbi:MAG: U32 family peptidase [Nanoarchaeota archaeon]|nr:U32 family peptidase [Nanoarchaeota archaeon]